MEEFARALLEVLDENSYMIAERYGDALLLPYEASHQEKLAGWITEALKRTGAAPILAVLATGITHTYQEGQAEGSNSPASEQVSHVEKLRQADEAWARNLLNEGSSSPAKEGSGE